MRERRSRSQAYQAFFNELATDLGQFASCLDTNSTVYNNSHAEKYKELNDQAIQIIINLIRQFGSARQVQVAEMYLQGKNQVEMAKILGIAQCSVTKFLYGNYCYDGRVKTKMYGGLAKKLKAVMLESTELKNILKQMEELE